MASLLSSFRVDSLCGSNISSSRISARPRAVLSRSNHMQIPYDLEQGQSRIFHKLPSGLSLEVLVQKGVVTEEVERRKDKNTEYPPLVFVHGSYHAAWCWAEHWLPFFSASGYDCYAISLLGQIATATPEFTPSFKNLQFLYSASRSLTPFPRSIASVLTNILHGQGESDTPSGSNAGTLQTHAGDIADFINKNVTSPPVLLGHSFGGLIIQYYIAALGSDQLREMKNLYPKLRGAVLICSVPPSGNSGLVWRYLFSKPIAAFKVTRSLAAKAFQNSLSLCRETFFSVTMEDHIVKRYQELMKESSRVPLFDLRKLNASLPVPKVPDGFLDILVLGASDDFIVDAEGLKETASFYGVPPVCVEAVAHDMMLDISWDKGAKVILSWLSDLGKKDA